MVVSLPESEVFALQWAGFRLVRHPLLIVNFGAIQANGLSQTPAHCMFSIRIFATQLMILVVAFARARLVVCETECEDAPTG